jgi:hypothetical protein
MGLVALSAALVACGGGSDEPCGQRSEYFGVSFEPSTYSLKVGQQATIGSKLTPESCRGDMHFSATSNGIPPGMVLQDGNVTGVPTQAGNYQFQLTMTGVDGYMDFGFGGGPRSNKVTVTVVP